ncbi:MAG: NAD(P)H-dependent oxidoreductase subunit E [Clostridia bacterium]
MSKICSVIFTETAEQKAKLDEIIATYKNVAGGLMPALQQVQMLFGYLPEQAQERLAEGFGVSEEEVYGIATFYSQFTMNPRGKYNFSVCLGTACYVRGSGEVLEELIEQLGIGEGGCSADGKFSINSTRCVGCCGLAPVMVVNDEVYGKLTKEDIPKLVEKYKNMD